ncbi:methyltransferase domain-containing protein [bacterium]|nr:methyltransferase domain-containing protein [bacterium]
MLPRTLEPEVMDSVEEAADYDAMDHAEVNRRFVDDLLAAVARSALSDRLFETGERVRILDVGTGTAQIPIELFRRPVSASVWAVDLAAEMLILGEHNIRMAGMHGRILLEQADAKSLPYDEGEFDVVMSNSIIHHIPVPSDSLREMIRVLRPGGLLFVRDLLRPVSEADVEDLVRTYAGNENDHSQQLFRQSLHAALTIAEVQDLLTGCGWPTEDVQQTTDRHWTISGYRAALSVERDPGDAEVSANDPL